MDDAAQTEAGPYEEHRPGEHRAGRTHSPLGARAIEIAVDTAGRLPHPDDR